MAVTARELTKRALITALVQDPRQQVEATDAENALWQLQRMAESWDTEKLWSYSTKKVAFNTILGQQEYTIGDGLTIDTTAPLYIQGSILKDENTLYPLQVMSQENFDSMEILTDHQAKPEFVYYRTSSAIGIYPSPDKVYEVTLNLPIEIGEITLDTILTFPSGYLGAFELGLAVILADVYGNEIPMTLRMEAQERKNRIKNLNFSAPIIQSGYTGARRFRTNILTNQ